MPQAACLLEITLSDKIVRAIEEELRLEFQKANLNCHPQFHTVAPSPNKPYLWLELLVPKQDAAKAKRIARKVFERAQHLIDWATSGKITANDFFECRDRAAGNKKKCRTAKSGKKPLLSWHELHVAYDKLPERSRRLVKTR